MNVLSSELQGHMIENMLKVTFADTPQLLACAYCSACTVLLSLTCTTNTGAEKEGPMPELC